QTWLLAAAHRPQRTAVGVHPRRQPIPRRRRVDSAGRLDRATARGRARRPPRRAGLERLSVHHGFQSSSLRPARTSVKHLAFFVCAALGSVPNHEASGAMREDRPVTNRETREQSPEPAPRLPEPDWAALGKYRAENARVGIPTSAEKRVVFFGDSITEAWS